MTKRGFAKEEDAADRLGRRIKSREGSIERFRKNFPERSQIIINGAMSSTLAIAMLKHVLGHNDHDILDDLRTYVHEATLMFELNGTSWIRKTTKDAAGNETTVEYPDKTLANSRTGHQVMSVALLAFDWEKAREFGSLINPETSGSNKITKYTTFLLDDQHYANAMAAYLNDDHSAARSHLDALSSDDHIIRMHGRCLGAIIDADAKGFNESLSTLLEVHEKKALQRSNLDFEKYHICLGGLALCKLAIDAGILEKQECPVSIFLPITLIDKG